MPIIIPPLAGTEMLCLCALLFTSEFPSGSLINTHLLRNGHVNSVPTFWMVERKQQEDLHGQNICENPTSQLLSAIGTAPHNLSPPIHHSDLSKECGLSSAARLPGFTYTHSQGLHPGQVPPRLEASVCSAVLSILPMPVLASDLSHILNCPLYSWPLVHPPKPKSKSTLEEQMAAPYVSSNGSQ